VRRSASLAAAGLGAASAAVAIAASAVGSSLGGDPILFNSNLARRWAKIVRAALGCHAHV
jgi:hypothetical protein